MYSRLSPRDLALTLCVVAAWGFSFVPIKWGLESLPPFMLHRWNVAGAAVALAGVAVLGAHERSTGGVAPLFGFMLVVAAALAWGAGNLIAKQSKGADMFALVVWSSLVPPPLLAFVSWIAPFALLVPVTGLASGTLFLGEQLTLLQMIGVAVVLAGLAINVYGPRLRGWLA